MIDLWLWLLDKKTLDIYIVFSNKSLAKQYYRKDWKKNYLVKAEKSSKFQLLLTSLEFTGTRYVV